MVLKPTSSATTILGLSRGAARRSQLECSPQVVGGLRSLKKALYSHKIMKEKAAIRKMKREKKIIKPKVPTVFENMDETDIFFLSIYKMTKQLPQVEQAKIKLLLSNSVLQPEIRNTSTPTVSLPIPSPNLSEVA